VIEVSGLTKHYGDFAAVRDVSFRVEKGDIFGFIGPNGAGKTTTIRILATLLDPTEGDIRVDGHSVISDPAKVRRAIGFMPDLFGVYDRVTVWEYLDFFGASYGIARAQRRRAIEDILQLTDLAPLRDRVCSELSKGNKQRLCIARTLIHDPAVLVLDEPANGLDPRARIELRELLKELRAMGKTIFLSSHILTELSDVCTAVAIMERGRIVTSGPIEQVIRESASAARTYTLRVLDNVEQARAHLEKCGPVSGIVCRDHALTFQFDGDAPRLAELVKSLALLEVGVIGLEEVKRDLEDVFIERTKGGVS
jgi:ABC-2 type transport system ATP-binding protein